MHGLAQGVSLAERLKTQARHLGFELVGIAPATAADGFDRLQDWLARGYAGEMGYMERHAQARRHPASILPTVRSVIMVALNYATSALSASEPSSLGRIARYALGQDYHDVLRGKLDDLLTWLKEQVPGTHGRGIVDTAPLLERDFARRAGLGWIGKNTMLINPALGSWFFLGALLVDVGLPADAPFAADHCGTCTACLDACPTQAFDAPGLLDARRCISYLTIEHRTSIPEELRASLGDWIFGCDVCQEVCPWNRKAPLTLEAAFAPRPQLAAVDLIELLGLTEEEFRRRFRHTALWRTKRRGLLRNAAIALGNVGDEKALPVLQRALTDDEALIREAAAWAIDAIGRRLAATR